MLFASASLRRLKQLRLNVARICSALSASSTGVVPVLTLAHFVKSASTPSNIKMLKVKMQNSKS